MAGPPFSFSTPSIPHAQTKRHHDISTGSLIFPLPPAPKKPGEKCSVDILSNPDYNEDKMLMKENVRELKTVQTPLVSIIVPVYNGAETIEKCLRRIQHQT